jgi:hypothetical protein
MILPDYWLPRPAMSLDDRARSSFDQLLARIQSAEKNALIQYTLTPPKWQFLCYIAEHHAIALHGTGNPDIRLFEPRQSDDLSAFGNQTAVYAAGDGLWAMFFAIVNRDLYPMSVTNACIRVADATGDVSEPRYIFSISQNVLPQRPWRTGFVYLLPSETFVTQPVLPFGAYEIRIPHLASLVEVTPIARLEITPDDFPFLADIRGHDDARLPEYAHALQTGGPWPEASDRGA